MDYYLQPVQSEAPVMVMLPKTYKMGWCDGEDRVDGKQVLCYKIEPGRMVVRVKQGDGNMRTFAIPYGKGIVKIGRTR